MRRVKFDIRIIEILLFSGMTVLGSLFGMKSITANSILFLTLSYAATIVYFIHLYLLNDWADFEDDKLDPTKQHRISQHMGKSQTLIYSIISGLVFLSLTIYLGNWIIIVGVVLLIASFVYSFPGIRLKAVPIASYPVHIVFATGYFLIGYLVFNNSIAIIALFSLFFSLVYIAGEINQELRDFEYDTRTKVMTTPHFIGKKVSFFMENTFFLISIAPICILAEMNIIIRPIFFLYLFMVIVYNIYSYFRAYKNDFSRETFFHFKKIYHFLYFLFGIILVVSRFITLI